MRDAGRPTILALIPAHDEAPRIGAVVEAAIAHVPVLVVDDGSSDETSTVAEAAGATVLRQVPNQGKGAALRAGFARAIADGVLAVVTLDGDGQHDPAELPRFIAAEREHPVELIVGKRDFGRMPLVRRLSNVLGTLLLSTAVGRWIPDNQSGYRLVGRRLMAEMLASRMESTGVPGRVQVSAAVEERLRARFRLASRGLVEIKGKGFLPTWFLEGETLDQGSRSRSSHQARTTAASS